MKRTKHSLSHYRLLTCDMAELIPVAVLDVLPGDTIQMASSALIRVSPLLKPVMHPISVRIHHWFVPYRLLWDDWEAFITGGSDGEGDGAVYPTITPGAGGIVEGELGDYFGLPTGFAGQPVVSAFPFRAYGKIFNEHYRDQDLVAERAVSTAGGFDGTTLVGTIARVAWEKDYLTMSRPWPQKGPDITLPLGTQAEVKLSATTGVQQLVRTTATHSLSGAVTPLNAGADSGLQEGTAGVDHVIDPNTTLYADLATATAVAVNDVRRAFALQRYQEARAMYGSRYTEYLRYLGVRSSDARLQRPEYLGGGKQTISFTEILQTAPTTSGSEAGVGDLKGHGIAAMRSRRFRKFFEEHGLIMSLMSVRPRTMYASGVHRSMIKTTKEDYFQKELELIGQQEVLNKEVYAGDSAPNDVFGYADRYAEYRHQPSGVSGEFRSTENDWHLARIFAGDQTLNSAFVTADPSKRIHAVQSNDVLWCMVNHSIQARRMVGRHGRTGRII